MSIVRATSPLATPTKELGVITWQRAVAQLELAHKNGNNLYPAKEDGGSWYVPKGYCFYFAGTIYYADADTLISGTRSNYIQMTASVDGATCTAAFLADLTGVTWDDSWNGYFDTSDNLVIVDEFWAANDGSIAEPKTIIGKLGGQIADSDLALDPMIIGRRITAENDITAEGTISILKNITADGTLLAGAKDLGYMLQVDPLTDNIFAYCDTFEFFQTHIKPRIDPTAGSQAIAAGASWLPPRGVYTMSSKK